MGLGSMLPERDPERLLALVVPGFTLQCIDPRTRAVPHSGAHCACSSPAPGMLSRQVVR